MKNILCIFLFVNISVCSYSQQSTDSLPSVLNPEKKAEFKGGTNSWLRFLENNLNRSLLSSNGAPSGSYRTIANFLIDAEGKVSDIRIEVNPGYGAAEEVIRILKLTSKQWVPASDQGKPVPYRHKQSVTLLSN